MTRRNHKKTVNFFSSAVFIGTALTAAAVIAVLSLFSGSRTHNESSKQTEISNKPGAGAVVFRLSEPMPANHPGAEASAYFASLVEKESGGRIRIKVYYNGELGSQEEVIDQLQFGGIAMGRLNILELAERVPSLESYFQTLMYEKPESIMAEFEKNRNKLVFDCQTEKLYPLAALFPDVRCIYSDELPVSSFFNTPDKNQPYKIGIISSTILSAAIEKEGAAAVNVVSADTYQSLRNGYMNARETAVCDFILSNDYPFINYVLISTYISCPELFIMSSEALNDITTAQRNMLISCAAEAAVFYRSRLDEFRKIHIPIIQVTKEVIITGDASQRIFIQ